MGVKFTDQTGVLSNKKIRVNNYLDENGRLRHSNNFHFAKSEYALLRDLMYPPTATYKLVTNELLTDTMTQITSVMN